MANKSLAPATSGNFTTYYSRNKADLRYDFINEKTWNGRSYQRWSKKDQKQMISICSSTEVDFVVAPEHIDREEYTRDCLDHGPNGGLTFAQLLAHCKSHQTQPDSNPEKHLACVSKINRVLESWGQQQCPEKIFITHGEKPPERTFWQDFDIVYQLAGIDVSRHNKPLYHYNQSSTVNSESQQQQQFPGQNQNLIYLSNNNQSIQDDQQYYLGSYKGSSSSITTVKKNQINNSDDGPGEQSPQNNQNPIDDDDDDEPDCRHPLRVFFDVLTKILQLSKWKIREICNETNRNSGHTALWNCGYGRLEHDRVNTTDSVDMTQNLQYLNVRGFAGLDFPSITMGCYFRLSKLQLLKMIRRNLDYETRHTRRQQRKLLRGETIKSWEVKGRALRVLKTINYECVGRTVLHDICGEHLTFNTPCVLTIHLIAHHPNFTRLNSLDLNNTGFQSQTSSMKGGPQMMRAGPSSVLDEILSLPATPERTALVRYFLVDLSGKYGIYCDPVASANMALKNGYDEDILNIFCSQLYPHDLQLMLWNATNNSDLVDFKSDSTDTATVAKESQGPVAPTTNTKKRPNPDKINDNSLTGSYSESDVNAESKLNQKQQQVSDQIRGVTNNKKRDPNRKGQVHYLELQRPRPLEVKKPQYVTRHLTEGWKILVPVARPKSLLQLQKEEEMRDQKHDEESDSECDNTYAGLRWKRHWNKLQGRCPSAPPVRRRLKFIGAQTNIIAVQHNNNSNNNSPVGGNVTHNNSSSSGAGGNNSNQSNNMSQNNNSSSNQNNNNNQNNPMKLLNETQHIVLSGNATQLIQHFGLLTVPVNQPFARHIVPVWNERIQAYSAVPCEKLYEVASDLIKFLSVKDDHVGGGMGGVRSVKNEQTRPNQIQAMETFRLNQLHALRAEMIYQNTHVTNFDGIRVYGPTASLFAQQQQNYHQQQQIQNQQQAQNQGQQQQTYGAQSSQQSQQQEIVVSSSSSQGPVTTASNSNGNQSYHAQTDSTVAKSSNTGNQGTTGSGRSPGPPIQQQQQSQQPVPNSNIPRQVQGNSNSTQINQSTQQTTSNSSPKRQSQQQHHQLQQQDIASDTATTITGTTTSQYSDQVTYRNWARGNRDDRNLINNGVNKTSNTTGNQSQRKQNLSSSGATAAAAAGTNVTTTPTTAAGSGNITNNTSIPSLSYNGPPSAVKPKSKVRPKKSGRQKGGGTSGGPIAINNTMNNIVNQTLTNTNTINGTVATVTMTNRKATKFKGSSNFQADSVSPSDSDNSNVQPSIPQSQQNQQPQQQPQTVIGKKTRTTKQDGSNNNTNFNVLKQGSNTSSDQQRGVSTGPSVGRARRNNIINNAHGTTNGSNTNNSINGTNVTNSYNNVSNGQAVRSRSTESEEDFDGGQGSSASASQNDIDINDTNQTNKSTSERHVRLRSGKQRRSIPITRVGTTGSTVTHHPRGSSSRKLSVESTMSHGTGPGQGDGGGSGAAVNLQNSRTSEGRETQTKGPPTSGNNTLSVNNDIDKTLKSTTSTQALASSTTATSTAAVPSRGRTSKVTTNSEKSTKQSKDGSSNAAAVPSQATASAAESSEEVLDPRVPNTTIGISQPGPTGANVNGKKGTKRRKIPNEVVQGSTTTTEIKASPKKIMSKKN